jgi:predicted nucleotidyltransferase/DNA-binding XRE family transcriptional regulator
MRASEVTAGAVLREARSRAGLTQRELAQRAGVSQSVIAAYERESREPSLATLAALVEATGISLTVDLGPPLPAAAAPPAPGPIGHRLRRRRAAVLALAARHRISDVRVFGSVARGDEGPTSDLDLLVHLPEGAGLFLLGRFKQDLEALLHVDVDVVPDDGVKPRVRANIAADLVAL